MFVTLKVQKVKRSWNVINLIAKYFTIFFFFFALLIFRISQIRETEISISYSNITILNLVPR